MKSTHGLRTYADPPPLRFSTRATAGRGADTYREKVK